MKVALISETLPPAPTGQAVTLGRLFERADPGDYCLVSANAPGVGAPAEGQLGGRYYRLRTGFRLTRGHRLGLVHAREALNVLADVFGRARQLGEILRRERCDAVVACTGDVADLPAAYLASRRADVPFYAFIFDHYTYREWRSPVRRLLAGRLERRLLRGAAGVIALNETVRDDLRARHGIEPEVIHNSFDIGPYAAPPPPPAGGADGEVRVVFTGDVYEAHYDAFRNLLAAIERAGRPGLRLHLYTARSAEELVGAGISGPVVNHGYLPPGDVPRVQREADALFLPLAFESPYPDLVRTSAPTKLGEYLAARRPVIVHAPPDSFPAWYFREHGCGVVVDHLDPEALAGALESVLGDEALRGEIVRRAWERARADFDIEVARRKFWGLLGSVALRRGPEA
jgi:glycosyltransferase involved in cell wall biosynthesis